MHFVIGPITDVETIAAGRSIRELERLREVYGPRRWRKLKGFATIELHGGVIRDAELHWYEVTGIGRREFKIKRFVNED